MCVSSCHNSYLRSEIGYRQYHVCLLKKPVLRRQHRCYTRLETFLLRIFPMKISRTGIRDFAIMILMPLFFASNMIIGRGATDAVEPFTLAFFRWFGALLILLPFAVPGLIAIRKAVSQDAMTILVLGFLGMWVCGAMVYVALDYTSATNGTLIYTTSPVMILLIEAMMRGKTVTTRQAIGSAAAFLGVAVIVLKGDPGALLRLKFNIGDLIILGCAFAWAVYSVKLKQEHLQVLPTMAFFTVIVAAGSLILLPFMVWEIVLTDRFPATVQAWLSIAGLVVFSSVLSYASYQFGVKRFGPSTTGMMLYLLPVYGVVLAILFLGESLQAFHIVGFGLVLPGVVLATVQPAAIRRLRPAG